MLTWWRRARSLRVSRTDRVWFALVALICCCISHSCTVTLTVSAQAVADDSAGDTSSGDTLVVSSTGSGYGWNGSCPEIAVPPPTSSDHTSLAEHFGYATAAWIGFAFITIASSQCAVIVKYVGLPLITGYMFFGVLVGPEVLEMVGKRDVGYLQPITHFALAFISISAGAELYLPELKQLFRRIITITLSATAVTFIVCTLVIWGLSLAGSVPFMQPLSGSCKFSIALIAATIMITQSPASAIAVVAELKAKGQFTSTMMGITVLTDLIVLVLYSICAAVANASCASEADGFHILDLALTLLCVLLAVGLGSLFGKLIIFLIWLPRLHGHWLVLPLGFGVFGVSHWFMDWTTETWGHGLSFDPLLICICAGYTVANQSRNRKRLLKFMAKVGPLIFIPFFTLTGAGLDLGTMFVGLGFALLIFFVRAATFFVGSYVGGIKTGMDRMGLQTLWLSMLTQAGVSLGIAAEVAIAFPQWGDAFASTVVSVILLNQIVGPPLCKYAIKKNGEQGMAVAGDSDGEEEEVVVVAKVAPGSIEAQKVAAATGDATSVANGGLLVRRRLKRMLFVGANISSLAIAQRLLDTGEWSCTFVETNEQKREMMSWLHVPERSSIRFLSAEQVTRRRERHEKREAQRRKMSARDMIPPSSFVDRGGGDSVEDGGMGATHPADAAAADDSHHGPHHDNQHPESFDDGSASIDLPDDRNGDATGAASSPQHAANMQEDDDNSNISTSFGDGGGDSINITHLAELSLTDPMDQLQFHLLKSTQPPQSFESEEEDQTPPDEEARAAQALAAHPNAGEIWGLRIWLNSIQAQQARSRSTTHTSSSSSSPTSSSSSTSPLFHAALVMLESDHLNFALCQTLLGVPYLLPRVVVEVQNPTWSNLFAKVGALPIFPYSLACHTIFRMVVGKEEELAGMEAVFEMVADAEKGEEGSNKSLSMKLASIIRPDTVGTLRYRRSGSGGVAHSTSSTAATFSSSFSSFLSSPSQVSTSSSSSIPLYLRHLSPDDRRRFIEQHPDPPLPPDIVWSDDESAGVGMVGIGMAIQSHARRSRTRGAADRLHGVFRGMTDDIRSAVAAASGSRRLGMPTSTSALASSSPSLSPTASASASDEDGQGNPAQHGQQFIAMSSQFKPLKVIMGTGNLSEKMAQSDTTFQWPTMRRGMGEGDEEAEEGDGGRYDDHSSTDAARPRRRSTGHK